MICGVSLEQYLREVRKISNLKDENIVTVYDAEYNDGVHMCTMEYIKGKSLNFGNILYANIESTTLESSGDNIDELDYITLYIYYEMFNNFKEKISIDKCKKHFFNNYKGFLSDEKYDEYINDLYKSNHKSYIEYREHLAKSSNEQNLYYRDSRIRTLLFDIIETHYEQDQLTNILYNIWKRLNEIKVNGKLYSEISSLDMRFKKYIV